jgi:hypothetical protein
MANRGSEAMNDNTASIKSASSVDVSGGNVALSRVTRGIYVGVAGDLEVIFAGDSTAVVLVGLAAGVWHPMQVQQINQAATDADEIVAGY